MPSAEERREERRRRAWFWFWLGRCGCISSVTQPKRQRAGLSVQPVGGWGPDRHRGRTEGGRKKERKRVGGRGEGGQESERKLPDKQTAAPRLLITLGFRLQTL